MEECMDRRSFVMALFGGLAAASVGGIAAAEAAQPKLVPTPAPEPKATEGGEALDADTSAALDKTDAEFSQYYYYRRPYYRRPYYRPRYYRRPYYRPRYYYRPRPYYRRRYYY
jgi:hypothetical protein